MISSFHETRQIINLASFFETFFLSTLPSRSFPKHVGQTQLLWS